MYEADKFLQTARTVSLYGPAVTMNDVLATETHPQAAVFPLISPQDMASCTRLHVWSR
jgi:hypothetical protein